ncbi:hypothetical protein R6Q59_012590 [Mikania micrantha]
MALNFIAYIVGHTIMGWLDKRVGDGLPKLKSELIAQTQQPSFAIELDLQPPSSESKAFRLEAQFVTCCKIQTTGSVIKTSDLLFLTKETSKIDITSSLPSSCKGRVGWNKGSRPSCHRSCCYSNSQPPNRGGSPFLPEYDLDPSLSNQSPSSPTVLIGDHHGYWLATIVACGGAFLVVEMNLEVDEERSPEKGTARLLVLSDSRTHTCTWVRFAATRMMREGQLSCKRWRWPEKLGSAGEEVVIGKGCNRSSFWFELHGRAHTHAWVCFTAVRQGGWGWISCGG